MHTTPIAQEAMPMLLLATAPATAGLVATTTTTTTMVVVVVEAAMAVLLVPPLKSVVNPTRSLYLKSTSASMRNEGENRYTITNGDGINQTKLGDLNFALN